MLISIVKKDSATERDIFSKVRNFKIDYVSPEIFIIELTFTDGTQTAREYDSTAYKVDARQLCRRNPYPG